jgi:hypothetical protein
MVNHLAELRSVLQAAYTNASALSDVLLKAVQLLKKVHEESH